VHPTTEGKTSDEPLVRATCVLGTVSALLAITLTTFRDVPRSDPSPSPLASLQCMTCRLS